MNKQVVKNPKTPVKSCGLVCFVMRQLESSSSKVVGSCLYYGSAFKVQGWGVGSRSSVGAGVKPRTTMYPFPVFILFFMTYILGYARCYW